MKEQYLKVIKSFKIEVKAKGSSLLLDSASVKQLLNTNDKCLRALRNDGSLAFVKIGKAYNYIIPMLEEYLYFNYCQCNGIDYKPRWTDNSLNNDPPTNT